MLQSLRGSKLPLRLLKSIYRRLLALLLHCVKHPIKTFIFVVKAYLLMMLFALCLAFSFGSFAQTADELACASIAGTYVNHSVLGPICGASVPLEQMLDAKCSGGIISSTRVTGRTNEELVSECRAHIDAELGPINCISEKTETSTGYRYKRSVDWLNPGAECSTTNKYSYTSGISDVKTIESFSCPPDGAPELTGPYRDGDNAMCYTSVPTNQEPCDCSDLTGSNPQGINYFYAANGTYSQANPPNCISRDDNENGDVPSCNCKLIATKWSSADVNINGTIYQRWQPIPDQNGVTGVFTGGQCDESEKDTPPEMPEKCYQLGNGQNFCLEDPDQKCAKIDGIMTCEAGCGTVNGEFFCFENDDPEEPLPDPDDEITDPDTPLNNMIKSDFKDVLGGTESRLDILARLMSDIKTNTSKGDGNLAAKQDATNRLLKEISDKLDDEGDDEAPTNPQPTYNTDKLEEFVNPNDWGEKNFRTVALAFKDRLLEAPVMQAVQGFFDVALSGSCPTWQTTVNMPFGGVLNINIDQLCSETMNNIWPAIRAIIVLIFSFLAFRVAFTNE